MKTRVARARLYLNTARFLRPRQIAYFVLRRLYTSHRVRHPAGPILRRHGVKFLPPLSKDTARRSVNEFCFLNVCKDFHSDTVDWASTEMPKLWRYNLHYFDYLLDNNRPFSEKSALISDWIRHNPIGKGDGWEPYTASLRVVNWIKFFLQADDNAAASQDFLQSLYLQTAWLENNIEYHILANHYLKNGKALYFAGVFFSGSDADRWHKKGLAILIEEAKEQILKDGGHFERSPMYHAIMVEDYLDVLNLVQNSAIGNLNSIELLKHKATKALRYLHDITMPDGEIPLFNDAAFGIAPTPEQLFTYARQVIGYERPSYPHDLTVTAKQDSGYFIMRQGEDALVFDCGPVGPDYQPGHAHCDTLSYELSLNGRRLVVDSGVYNYENSAERHYARSTRAHNTVSVDQAEQSEIWGVFRVARRAYPLAASIMQTGPSSVNIEGAHDGYKRLKGNIIHARSIKFNETDGYRIYDKLEGRGRHLVESFIHLHPDFSVTVNHDVIAISTANKQAFAVIQVNNGNIRVERGWYFPEFGVKMENVLIVLWLDGNLPLQLNYQIKKLGSSAAESI